MSRIGKMPINLPDKTLVKIAGRKVTVKGPKGTQRTFGVPTTITLDGNVVSVSRADDSRQARSGQGLVRSLLANMVAGVSAGFTRQLKIVGVGYKVENQGQYVQFDLGYSHPIYYEVPAGVEFTAEKGGLITLKSIDKEVLGRAAATIRSFRKPEPYKGKGIRYADERIVTKVGKAGGK